MQMTCVVMQEECCVLDMTSIHGVVTSYTAYNDVKVALKVDIGLSQSIIWAFD